VCFLFGKQVCLLIFSNSLLLYGGGFNGLFSIHMCVPRYLETNLSITVECQLCASEMNE